jgi:drug/metabolite transporter (DMT)-like permease
MTASPSVPFNPATANLICVASMMVWAAGLPAADLIIPLIPPLPLTAMRTGLAALVLMIVWVALEGFDPVRRANWAQGIFVGGICIGLGAVFLVIGQAYTDAVTVSIITASMPLIGIGLEILLDGRQLSKALILGLLLSLAGGMIALAQGGFSLDLGLGAIAAFASCLAFTWGSRATIVTFPDMTPLGRTTLTVSGAFIASLTLTLAWAALGGPPVLWAAIGWREIGALAIFGIGSLALSQILWIIGVERIGIGAASLHMNAVPFYVMIFAFAFGAEWNWLQAFGAVVVVIGVLIAQNMIRLPTAALRQPRP